MLDACARNAELALDGDHRAQVESGPCPKALATGRLASRASPQSRRRTGRSRRSSVATPSWSPRARRERRAEQGGSEVSEMQGQGERRAGSGWGAIRGRAVCSEKGGVNGELVESSGAPLGGPRDPRAQIGRARPEALAQVAPRKVERRHVRDGRPASATSGLGGGARSPWGAHRGGVGRRRAGGRKSSPALETPARVPRVVLSPLAIPAHSAEW